MKLLGVAEPVWTCIEFPSSASSFSIGGNCDTCVSGLKVAALVDMFSFIFTDESFKQFQVLMRGWQQITKLTAKNDSSGNMQDA